MAELDWTSLAELSPPSATRQVDLFAPTYGGLDRASCDNYDTRGQLLYRVWHDGAPGNGYWMDKARLLVVTGLNSEVYWPKRIGTDIGEAHPIVVYALQPRLGYVGETWTTPSPGRDTTTLSWYRCVLPPDASKLLSDFRVMRPLPGFDPGRFVTLSLYLKDTDATISWILDAAGNEVEGTRTPNDRWRIDNRLPVDYFKLGDLPPILPDPPGN